MLEVTQEELEPVSEAKSLAEPVPQPSHPNPCILAPPKSQGTSWPKRKPKLAPPSPPAQWWPEALNEKPQRLALLVNVSLTLHLPPGLGEVCQKSWLLLLAQK